MGEMITSVEDFPGWVRDQLWRHQVPATVLQGPAGGAQVTFDSGETMTFPGAEAVRWFLAGWDARDRATGEDLGGIGGDTGDEADMMVVPEDQGGE
jgi:hypothetical protein